MRSKYAAVMLLLSITACSGGASTPSTTPLPTVVAPTPTPEPTPDPVAEKEGCIFEGTGQAGVAAETFTIWLTDATEKECYEWKRTAEGVEPVTKRPRGVPACDLQVEGVRVRVYGGNVAEFVCASL